MRRGAGCDGAARDRGIGDGAKCVDADDTNAMTYAGLLPTGVELTHSEMVDTATHVVCAYAGKAGELVMFKPIKE